MNILGAHIDSPRLDIKQNPLYEDTDFAKNPSFADGSTAKGAIYDGRDTGTVVCPQADIKFFITASSEVRAKRRFKELQEKGIDTPYEKVLADIVSRDERDSQRSTAPLKAAPDAHIIDTSNMDIDEVVAKAREIIENYKESA